VLRPQPRLTAVPSEAPYAAPGNANGHRPGSATLTSLPALPRPQAPRAPWTESKVRIPYVVITTQPWPTEWWRPPSERVATNGAVARPIEIVALPREEAPPAEAPRAPERIAEPVVRLPERARPSRQRRRGMLTRLAIVAIGVVISLIAVETASRRRS